MALLRQEEEEMMPHKRKRKTKEEKLKETGGADKGESQPDYEKTKEYEEEMPEKRVKSHRPPPPPQMDFHELLKIAEKKQFEPVKVTPKVTDEDERPMTKKQRAEYMKEKEWRLRKEGKLPPLTASKQVTVQPERKILSQSSEERSRIQKSSRPAAAPGHGQRNNRPAIDRNADQRRSQLSADGQREQMGSQPSGYGNKDHINGRFADQRTGRPSGDVRDARNAQLLEGNKDQRGNRSSENGNFSIPRFPKVSSSGRVDEAEKSQQRIPKLNDSGCRSVKLQGNSGSKVGKERSRDVPGRLNVKDNYASSSAFGQGSANRKNAEERKVASVSSSSSGNSNYSLSGYSKKLQESLLAKLQEKERSGKPSEASKFRVPEAPAAKYPKTRDSGSFSMNRGSKQQSNLTRSSDSKDAVKESSLTKDSVRPSTSLHKVYETPHGAQESSVRSTFGREVPSRDARKPIQIPSKDTKQRPSQPSDARVKPRQFPPTDVRPRQLPPADVRPRQFPPADVRSKRPPKREYNLLLVIYCHKCEGAEMMIKHATFSCLVNVKQDILLTVTQTLCSSDCIDISLGIVLHHKHTKRTTF
jgi:protein SPT2